MMEVLYTAWAAQPNLLPGTRTATAVRNGDGQYIVKLYKANAKYPRPVLTVESWDQAKAIARQWCDTGTYA